MRRRAEQICKAYSDFIGEDVPFDAVLFGKRHQNVSAARRVILYRLYFEFYGKHTQTEIASMFGLTKGAVIYANQIVRETMRYDMNFRNFVEKL
jgi:hypothetical protein